MNKPQHSGEGGLGTSDEVAITRDHQLSLFSVVFRNVGGLPVESNKRIGLMFAECFGEFCINVESFKRVV